MRLLVLGFALAACGSRETRSSDKHVPLATTTLPASDYAAPIGTAHPIVLVAAAENGRWLVACQARRDTDGEDGIHIGVGLHGDLYGDAMVPYLFRGGGEGREIGELVAISQDDRWLVVFREGKLVLVDDRAGTEATIPDADVRPDQRGRARSAHFDSRSKRLIYFRDGKDAGNVVIRDLESQRERVVAVPKSSLWHVESAMGSRWIPVAFVRDDTNHNGKLDWPTVHTTAPLGKVCTGPAASYSMFGGEGDAVARAWIDLDAGQLREDQSILAFVGNDAVVKAADKSVRIGNKTIVPAGCDADVLAASENPVRLVVTCRGTETAGPIELFGPGVHVGVKGQKVDSDRPHDVRMLDSTYLCTDPETCIALQDGKPIALRGSVRTIRSTRILTLDDEQYFVTDGPGGKPQALPGVSGAPRAAAGDVIAIDTSIVNLATAKVLGHLPRDPMLIDVNGRGLLASNDGDREFPEGPLRWVAASSATTAAAPADAPTEPTWTIEGVAVDEHGSPVANALVTVSEAQFKENDDGSSSSREPWTPPGVAAKGMAAFAFFSQYALPKRTDAQGRFTWSPVMAQVHSVMVVADDGRVGSVDVLKPGDSKITITLRAPASLRVVCNGFEPMDPDLGAGGIDIVTGARRIGAACGETVGALPPARYVLAAKQDAFKYAGAEVDLKAGTTREVVLKVRAPGTISGRVVEFPGDKPISGSGCQARWSYGAQEIGGDPGATSKADGSFELRISQGRVNVWCEGEDLAQGVTTTEVGSTPSKITVRVVRIRPHGIDLGAEIEAEADGARIIKASGVAEKAGLQVHDLVLAVDGTKLAGLSRSSMQALAFFWPRDAKPRWTILRDGKTLTLP
jgi:hypothetical protein